jgi:hypothetical protein
MLKFLSPKVRSFAASLSVGLLAALAACTDGSTVATAPAAATAIAVTGTAAVGAPLANATVSLLCGKGGKATNATTSAQGTYTMSLGSDCVAPYFLKVTGVEVVSTPPTVTASVTLYAFADAAGNINITPLTHIAASVAAGGDPDALYAAVEKESKTVAATWNATSKKDASDKLTAKLKDLGLDGDAAKITDLLQGKFKADGVDPLDALLDKLKKARGGVPLSSLVESLVQAGGQPGTQPWNVLFPAGATSVTLVGTGCTYESPNPGYTPGFYSPPPASMYFPPVGFQTLSTNLAGTATVTLTKGTSSLNISATSGTTLFTVSPFAAGGSAGGQFSFSLGGGQSEVRSVEARAGDERTGFNYFNESDGPSRPAAAVLDTVIPVDGARKTFSVSWPSATPTAYASTNTLNCQTLTPFNPGKFDLSARVATVLKGITSTVASSTAQPCQSQTYVLMGTSGSYSQGTYSYSVSPIGEVKFNGTSLSSSFPSGATNVYSEYSYFTSTGVLDNAQVSIALDNNSNASLFLDRTYGAPDRKPASFNHYCSRRVE